MLPYSLIKPWLFHLDAERAHYLALNSSALLHKGRCLPNFSRGLDLPAIKVMGLDFAHPVGVAAGLDKNGDYIDVLGQLGFSFIEIGTLTPRPQAGNPKPRLFRLPEHRAIINRMGFNNKGIDHAIAQVKRRKYSGILGINIGKNFDTPIEKSLDDYILGVKKSYDYADYITVNISSPNTPNLRDLQFGEQFTQLLSALKNLQNDLHQQSQRYVPIAIKIAPDMQKEQLQQLAQVFVAQQIDAVIATNTTIEREAVKGDRYADEAGGLSGAPLTEAAHQAVAILQQTLAGKIPIIGVGGIMSAQDAEDKLAQGAQLIQLYSGLIYRGPELLGDVLKRLSR